MSEGNLSILSIYFGNLLATCMTRCAFNCTFYRDHKITVAICCHGLDGYIGGSSALNRGHEPHRAIRRCKICEGRPRRFGGVQRGGGTWNANSSRTDQQWSVIPAAMAGVRLVAGVPVAWGARRRLA